MRRALINGRIHCLDDKRTVAEAIAIDGNRILEVGTNAEILALMHEEELEAVVDLEGKVVLPGFNDSHLHLLSYGYGKTIADLEGVDSRDSVKEIIRTHIEKNQIPPGQWVGAAGWNNDNWDDSRNLTKEDLDQISTEHPIYAVRICGHISALNTKAMEVIGLNRNTPQPHDGHYEVDEMGEPTGSIAEMMNLVYNQIEEPDIEAIKSMILRTCQDASRVGITSMQTDDFDTLPGRNFRNIIAAYRQLIAENRLNVRVSEQCALADLRRFDEFLAAGFRLGEGDNFYRLDTVKLYIDGSLGSRTAWLLEDYSDDPGNQGFAVYRDERRLFEVVERAHRMGTGVVMHCIGDAACEQAISAVEAAQKKYPGIKPRHGLIHAQILNDDLCERMIAAGIYAYIQPIFIEYDLHMAEERVGAERIKTSYHWRTMKDMGIEMSMGTDCPVESFNPMLNIYAAVTRKDLDEEPKAGWYPKEALTVEEAVDGYTFMAARMSGEEDCKGRLLPGMLADLVVLDEDIFSVSPERIKEISVAMTIVDGRIVYANATS